MLLLAEKINTLNLGWNERPLDEADFHRICRRFKITVTEMPLRVSGFYYRVKGHDFIAIDSRLEGSQKLVVMFHELAHFLFHTPESGATASFNGIGRKTRQESEADAFALCAVIPRNLIESPELSCLDDLPESTVAERLKLLERYGI